MANSDIKTYCPENKVESLGKKDETVSTCPNTKELNKLMASVTSVLVSDLFSEGHISAGYDSRRFISTGHALLI